MTFSSSVYCIGYNVWTHTSSRSLCNFLVELYSLNNEDDILKRIFRKYLYERRYKLWKRIVITSNGYSLDRDDFFVIRNVNFRNAIAEKNNFKRFQRLYGDIKMIRF